MNLIKTETDLLTLKQTYSYQRGRGGGIRWEYGLNRCTLPYTKQVNNKGFTV